MLSAQIASREAPFFVSLLRCAQIVDEHSLALFAKLAARQPRSHRVTPSTENLATVHSRRVPVARAHPGFLVPRRSFRCNVEIGQYLGSVALMHNRDRTNHVQTFRLRY